LFVAMIVSFEGRLSDRSARRPNIPVGDGVRYRVFIASQRRLLAGPDLLETRRAPHRLRLPLAHFRQIALEEVVEECPDDSDRTELPDRRPARADGRLDD